jgi:uroporphyrinogen-III decarboxylase
MTSARMSTAATASSAVVDDAAADSSAAAHRYGRLRVADTAPFGDTLLEEAMARMPGMPLMGGLDQIAFLRQATPAAVKEQTRKRLDVARQHGRFIVGANDYFNERTPLTNLQAMREAVDESGQTDRRSLALKQSGLTPRRSLENAGGAVSAKVVA